MTVLGLALQRLSQGMPLDLVAARARLPVAYVRFMYLQHQRQEIQRANCHRPVPAGKSVQA